MRTIIAGSRDGVSYEDVETAMRDCGWTPTLVISGGARGADHFGERWAKARGIPVHRELPRGHGPFAPKARNVVMAGMADALVLIWTGSSPGSLHMLEVADDRRLRIFQNIVGLVE